jgi:hypothetical protein
MEEPGRWEPQLLWLPVPGRKVIRGQALVLTSDPVERLDRKLLRAVWAPSMLPELSAAPIWERKVEKELSAALLVLEVSVVVLDIELSVDVSRLVSES